jgi:hypothetical protein
MKWDLAGQIYMNSPIQKDVDYKIRGPMERMVLNTVNLFIIPLAQNIIRDAINKRTTDDVLHYPYSVNLNILKNSERPRVIKRKRLKK